MIYDTLENIQNYKGIAPNLIRALEILRDTDFSKQEDGAHEVDGFNFRYLLQSYTVDSPVGRPEAHKDFIDIQFLIKGEEQVGTAQLKDKKELDEARPDSDVWFYRCKTEKLTLTGDRFLIFFPNDIHEPCLLPADGKAQAVRKCVFKVHV